MEGSPCIKICGVRDEATMRACMDAGVEYVGLNFAPGSRRAIDVGEAEALQTIAAGSGIRFVGVFRDTPVRLVLRIAERLGLDLVQLHGRETPADCERASQHVPVIKALPASELLLKGAMYRPHVVRLLVDGRSPGSGEAWDYASIGGARDLFLAGGLNATNVADAIRLARPWGVDTASGVERDGEPCPDLVHAFVHAARHAAAQEDRGMFV